MKIRRPKVFNIMNNNFRTRESQMMYNIKPLMFSNEDLSERSTSSLYDLIELNLFLDGDDTQKKNCSTFEQDEFEDKKLILSYKSTSKNTILKNTHRFNKNTNCKFHSNFIGNNQSLNCITKANTNQKAQDSTQENSLTKDEATEVNTDEKDDNKKMQPESIGNDANECRNRFYDRETPEDFQQDNQNTGTKFLCNEDINLINHILEIIRVFNFQLKSKETFSVVEFTSLDNKDCFCYHYSLFADKMKEFVPSAEFIFNEKIKTKSGSLLFYTSDFKFAIKTVRKSDLQTAIDYIGPIYSYYRKNPSSFIVPILGIYSTPLCCFIIMKNIFDNPFDEIFDLKGENINRKGKADSCICEEKEWDDRKLKINNKEKVLEILKADSDFLRSLELMDYSLVVGVTLNNNNEFRVYNSKGRDTGNAPLFNRHIAESFGIVDVLTVFDWRKRFEFLCYKLCCCENASCIDPEKYSKRFNDFVAHKIFDDKEE